MSENDLLKDFSTFKTLLRNAEYIYLLKKNESAFVKLIEEYLTKIVNGDDGTGILVSPSSCVYINFCDIHNEYSWQYDYVHGYDGLVTDCIDFSDFFSEQDITNLWNSLKSK